MRYNMRNNFIYNHMIVWLYDFVRFRCETELHYYGGEGFSLDVGKHLREVPK